MDATEYSLYKGLATFVRIGYTLRHCIFYMFSEFIEAEKIGFRIF